MEDNGERWYTSDANLEWHQSKKELEIGDIVKAQGAILANEVKQDDPLSLPVERKKELKDGINTWTYPKIVHIRQLTSGNRWYTRDR